MAGAFLWAKALPSHPWPIPQPRRASKVRMAVDRITQRPKGFGFVTYKSDVEAQKALKAMNGRDCRAGK
ncbi:glycine-rich RNA-binding protein 4 mitochondrial isoform X2 [Prunus yedoensis var. nudiflora]|uniref:Glycine-rich RNA-binding protein 4 mitochondrial isoform X2 n=1 Tax=Prunus yedoensis var. nudiflora TaxID=2094558 RepID=A0A314Z8I9_PRUYE|nr:glycine-rich RNA-binding protein 4 mitochondrial isoform X2 [Prunus yedoensis var. nudiflora]